MRLRASGDRHEIRQEYLPVLWHRLVKDLERRGKDCVEEVIQLMDSYFLTKDDWDAILELGVGVMATDSVKIESQAKASFTRLYNQQSHPLPFMKASNVIVPKKSSKDKPDLEEALDDSDFDDDPAAEGNGEDEDEDAPLDLKKDKYVKAPKKKVKRRKSAGKKAVSNTKGKGKLESEEEIDDEDEEEDSGRDEDVKPKKGKAPAKGKAVAPRGRPRKNND